MEPLSPLSSIDASTTYSIIQNKERKSNSRPALKTSRNSRSSNTWSQKEEAVYIDKRDWWLSWGEKYVLGTEGLHN